MKDKTNNRRNFLKKTLAGTTAISIGGILPGFSAKSYRRISGAAERINVGVMGVNSRGFALASNFASQDNFQVISISDVDSLAADKCISEVKKIGNNNPKAVPDFRKALENPDVDALVIAAPDHWHAPAAITALKAGKHVYVEKPCSHNPNEGELLVKATKQYNKVVQMGNQRRSYPNVVEAMAKMKEGVIGRVYYTKGWYTNNRKSIGQGKKAPVPSNLDFDLWQGPAPRKDYQDNLIHYNWHWFWHWGTGESLNNGVHTVDLMRWGLGVDFPIRVTSAGGRYRYDDDWQTPDTQVITCEFDNNSSMMWEGRSCNGKRVEENSVGVVFYGETGSLVIGSGNSYKIYDLNNKIIADAKSQISVDAQNKMNPSQQLDAIHIQNFYSGIMEGKTLNSQIAEGHKSTLLCQLGNIALRTGDALSTDPRDGHIKDNIRALEFWKREYEPGWEVKL